MVAGAAFGALHPTVAGKEITAHAQGKAVGLITAKKLLFPDLHDWHQPLFAPIVVVQGALDVFEVHDPWVLVPMASRVSPMLVAQRCYLVDPLKPLHLTITE